MDAFVSVDYTALLPLHILHIILSHLTWKDAARTSVLSKRWRQARDTHDIIVFDQRRYEGSSTYLFPKYVDDFLQRRVEQKYDFQKFELVVYCSYKLLNADITRWLKVAVENNVKDLSLYICKRLGTKFRYKILSSVLASKTLTAISLHRCKLRDLDGLNLPNLKKLTLCKCPSIEMFTLCKCDGLVNLQVSNLEQLKSFRVIVCRKIQRIDILAHKLESFRLRGLSFSLQYAVNTVGCSTLKELALKDIFIDDHSFERLIHGFPYLESLDLYKCHSLQSFKISLPKLKSLCIRYCMNLTGGNFHTPQLESLVYIGGRKMIFSSFNSLRKATLLFGNLDFRISGDLFPEIQKFFSSVEQSRGFKLVMLHERKVAVYQHWKYLKIPCLSGMGYEIIEPTVKLEKLLDRVLLFQPKTLSLFGDDGWQKIMFEKVNNLKERLKCYHFENQIRKCGCSHVKTSASQIATNDLETWMASIEAEELPAATVNLSWNV